METVFVAGATGFVGSHVRPVLRQHGFDLICGSRHPSAGGDDQHRRFDLSKPKSIERAIRGATKIVYLVHSMAEGHDYDRIERENAINLRDVAAKEGIERIVYLGGMRPRGKLSKHLASRIETGRILREGQVPTVELRATMIVGGGSESFRIIRDLSARLPWMMLPKWLDSVSEPIAVADVAEAIAHALVMPLPGEKSCIRAMPGPEALSGRAMIERTAKALGHAPRLIRIPLVTPHLSSYWIRLVTRAKGSVATELVEGLRTDILASGKSIWDDMPDYERTSFDRGVKQALTEERESLPPAAMFVERALHRLAER